MEENNNIKVFINLSTLDEFKAVVKEIKAVKEENPFMNFQFSIDVAGLK